MDFRFTHSLWCLNSEQIVLCDEVELLCHGESEVSHYESVLVIEHVIFGFVTL